MVVWEWTKVWLQKIGQPTHYRDWLAYNVEITLVTDFYLHRIDLLQYSRLTWASDKWLWGKTCSNPMKNLGLLQEFRLALMIDSGQNNFGTLFLLEQSRMKWVRFLFKNQIMSNIQCSKYTSILCFILDPFRILFIVWFYKVDVIQAYIFTSKWILTHGIYMATVSGNYEQKLIRDWQR